MNKICTKCKIKQELSQFYNKPRHKLHCWCKECCRQYSRQYQKQYRKDNPGKSKQYYKQHIEETKQSNRINALRVYNITPEDYDRMFKAQNGVCAICGGVNKDSRNLFVDHNHTTGKVRGLLCSNCNFAIGHMKDNVKLLQNLIKYLLR